MIVEGKNNKTNIIDFTVTRISPDGFEISSIPVSGMPITERAITEIISCIGEYL